MNMRVYLSAILLGPLLISGPAQAAMSWSSQLPRDGRPAKAENSEGGHAHGGHRGGKPFFLKDSVGAEAEIWFPTLVRRPLEVSNSGVVKVSGTGLDNYHLLYARRKGEGSDELALRYQPMRGKPSGESPRLLIGYRKGALDIVPSPLTREHQRYESGETASFTLMFKNRPLSKAALTLTTSNGTRHELQSDAKGEVSMVLPDDFAVVEPGRSANKPAEFVLEASYRFEDTEYHITLSADYHVNPAHWQSHSGGLLAMLAGFVGGLAVIRRSRQESREVKGA